MLVGLARDDMAEVCPDAWMLNITNPMTCLTRAVCRETPVRAVGLCHEVVGNWTIGTWPSPGVDPPSWSVPLWPGSTICR